MVFDPAGQRSAVLLGDAAGPFDPGRGPVSLVDLGSHWFLRKLHHYLGCRTSNGGLDDQRFIDTQLEYLAFFIALQELVGTGEAVDICKEVMGQASYAPMLLCLPEREDVRAIGDPMDVMRAYLRAMPEASQRGGSHQMEIVEDTEDAFEFDVGWCVWLELARAAGVPEACIPNCHADDLVFPDYFGSLGIDYRRTQTLACGGNCCDFRFERRAAPLVGAGSDGAGS